MIESALLASLNRLAHFSVPKVLSFAKRCRQYGVIETTCLQPCSVRKLAPNAIQRCL